MSDRRFGWDISGGEEDNSGDVVVAVLGCDEESEGPGWVASTLHVSTPNADRVSQAERVSGDHEGGWDTARETESGWPVERVVDVGEKAEELVGLWMAMEDEGDEGEEEDAGPAGLEEGKGRALVPPVVVASDPDPFPPLPPGTAKLATGVMVLIVEGGCWYRGVCVELVDGIIPPGPMLPTVIPIPIPKLPPDPINPGIPMPMPTLPILPMVCCAGCNGGGPVGEL
ncbi:hypothetical protein HDU93_006150 [Gonapodya sp. JEL0774]|nr:hypothetical protein HDU93_006150 [Gonapodya sp. JEL0774]